MAEQRVGQFSQQGHSQFFISNSLKHVRSSMHRCIVQKNNEQLDFSEDISETSSLYFSLKSMPVTHENSSQCLQSSEVIKSRNTKSVKEGDKLKAKKFMELIKMQLSQYHDINDNDFVILNKLKKPKIGEIQQKIPIDLDEKDEMEPATSAMLPPSEPSNSQYYSQISEIKQESYMHMSFHSFQVPIGQYYQATIPSIMSLNSYRKKSKFHMKTIKKLQVHSPQTDSQFYQQHYSEMIKMFNSPTLVIDYNDINVMRNYYTNYCEEFPAYQMIKQNMEQEEGVITFNEFMKNQKVMDFWIRYYQQKDKTIYRNRRKKNKVRFPFQAI